MDTDRGHLILAILRAADEQGERALLTTALMKYLYLADVYAAEASQGAAILTGARWRFLHYGPYAAELQEDVDRLVVAGLVMDRPWAARDDEVGEQRSYRAFALVDRSRAPSLDQVGVPRYVRARLPAAIRRYGSDLGALLSHVYYETAPMAEARPRAELDFSGCRPQDLRQYKPMPMRALSKKKIKRGREAIRRLAKAERASQETRVGVHGPYDDVYWKALAELEDEPLPTGARGRAKLR